MTAVNASTNSAHLSDISTKISTVPAALAFLGVYRPRTLASFRADDDTVVVWYRNGRDSWDSRRVDVVKFTEKLRWRTAWSYDAVRSLSTKVTALVADRRSMIAEIDQLQALAPSTLIERELVERGIATRSERLADIVEALTEAQRNLTKSIERVSYRQSA